MDHKQFFDERYKRFGFFMPNDICFGIYGRNMWLALRQKIRISETIVDFGCGGGTLLTNVYFENMKARLIGIDFSCGSKASFEKNVPVAEFRNENVTRTSLKENSVDLALSTMTIEHVEEEPFLNEIKRVLKPGGFFFISSVIKKTYGWYFYKNSKGKRVLDPTHLKEYSSEKEFKDLLTRFGFQTIENSTSPIKYSFIDPVIKFLFRNLTREKSQRLLSSRFIEFLRKYSQIPIPRYYAIECLAKNKK